MIVGIDHVVIGVRDLAASSKRLSDRLGLSVQAGGRHPDLGSANAIIAFDDHYLELLGLEDEHQARAAGTGLVEALSNGGGLLTFALRTNDLDTALERLNDHGTPFLEAPAGRRERPDGVVLEWRYAFADGAPLLSPRPFLIEWADSSSLHATSPSHPIGATGVATIDVATGDLDSSISWYRDGLGMTVEEPGDGTARLSVGSAQIRLAGSGGVDAPPDSSSTVEGITAVDIAVQDLEAAIATLRSRGAPDEALRRGGHRRRIDVSSTVIGIDGLGLLEV